MMNDPIRNTTMGGSTLRGESEPCLLKLSILSNSLSYLLCFLSIILIRGSEKTIPKAARLF
jgi:hypothetical protein